MQIPDVDISSVNEGCVLDGPRVVVTKFGGLIDVRQVTVLHSPAWTTRLNQFSMRDVRGPQSNAAFIRRIGAIAMFIDRSALLL